MKNKFKFVIKTNKMKNQASFMKRIFYLSVWLSKRYNLKYSNANFDYYFHDNLNKKILTIEIDFT
jgi:hypothetical protein